MLISIVYLRGEKNRKEESLFGPHIQKIIPLKYGTMLLAFNFFFTFLKIK